MRIADVFVAIRADPTEFNAAIRGLDANLKNVSRNLGQIGSAMTRNITLPLAALAGGTSKMALDFERTFGQLVGLAGVSKGSIDELRDSIFELSQTTGKGPQDLAEAFYFVASAGFEANDAMEVLDVSARASAAGMGEVSDIARVLGGVINSYGKENLSAAEAADILTRAVGEGAAEAVDFAGVLPQVIPTAAALGVEFEEVAGALAAMTTAGAPASQAAVGLNQVFTTLLRPTSRAEETLRSFGLSAQGLRTVLREEGTIAVLRLLEESFGDNEVAMGQVFGNVRALRGAFQLLNLDADELDAIMAATAEHSGALGEAFGAIPEDVLAFDRAMADLQVQAIQIGRDVLPTVVNIVTEVANVLRAAVGWWKSLDEEMQGNIIRWALIAAVAGPVLSILAKLITVGRGVVLVFKGLVNAASFMYTAWRNIPTLLGYVDLALAKVKGAALATRAAMISMILPITAAVSALWLIANVGEAVSKALDPVGHAFNTVASQVGKSRVEIEGEVNKLAQELGLSGEEIKRRLTDLLERGFSWDRAILNLRNSTGEVSDALTDSEQRWEEYQNQISGAAESTAGRVSDALADLPPEIRAQLEAAGFVLEDEAAMFDVLAEEAAAARKAVIDQMAAMLAGMAALFVNDEDVQKAFQDLLDRMDDPYTEAERKADIFSQNMLTLIKKALDSDDPGAVAATVEFVNRLLGEFAVLEPGALESGQAVPPAIRDGMDANIQELIDYIEEHITGEAISSLSLDEAEQVGIDGIYLYNQGMLSQERAAGTAGQRVADAAKQGVGSIDFTETGGEKAQEVATGLSYQHDDLRLAGYFAAVAAKGGFDSVDMSASGAAMINELIWGINNNMWRLQAAAYNAANQWTQVFPQSEPKDPKSPFRGITKWGRKIVGTIADDVMGSLNVARQASLAMAGAFAPELSPAFAGLSPMASSSSSTVSSTTSPGPTPGAVASGGNVYNVHLEDKLDVRSVSDIGNALRRLGEAGLLPGSLTNDD